MTQPVERTLAAGAVRVSLAHAGQDDPAPIVLEPGADGVTVDGSRRAATLERVGSERAVLRDAATALRHRVLLLPSPPSKDIPPGVTRQEVVIDGWRIEVDVESAGRAELRDRARRGRDEAGQSGPTKVHAIIPGVVVSVSVAAGDAVSAGQQLLVVEAMKMQNELRAPREGTIEQVAVAPGARIDVGDLLLVIA